MKIVWSIIMFLLVVTSHNGWANENGGHDGGGANLWSSSPGEVRAAVEWAIGELRENHAIPGWGPTWLFNSLPFIRASTRDFPETTRLGFCMSNPGSCYPDRFKRFAKPWDVIQMSSLELKEDGPCPAPGEKNAAGSVSAFREGADLCLSIYELSRTLPMGLKAQVASVLAHEYVHLLGFGEPVARAVQKAIVENFGLISRTDGSFLAYRIVSGVSAEDFTQRAILSARAGDMSQAVFYLGQLAGLLTLMQEMLPDNVNDRTIPVKNPDLFTRVDYLLGQMIIDLEDLVKRVPRTGAEEFSVEVEKFQIRIREFVSLLERFLAVEPQGN